MLSSGARCTSQPRGGTASAARPTATASVRYRQAGLTLDATVSRPGVLASQAVDEVVELAPESRSLPVPSSPIGGPFTTEQFPEATAAAFQGWAAVIARLARAGPADRGQ